MTIACPKCSSQACKKNGFTRHGKQNHRCLDCGRQFSMEPEVNFVLEVKGQFKNDPSEDGSSKKESETNSSSENNGTGYNRFLSQ